MGLAYAYDRSDSDVPINLSVSRQFQGAIKGLTPLVAVRDARTQSHYLDWSDMTFKTSGWLQKHASMIEADDGHYVYVGGLNVAAITNLTADIDALTVEFRVDEAQDKAIVHDLIRLTDSSLAAIAAKIDDLIICAEGRLKFDPSTQKMTLYKLDGVTPFKQWTLYTDQGEPVVSRLGVQSERGIQEL